MLRKIHAWITAWSEMARTVITRRDHMIKLGIAKRRSHRGKGGAVTPAAPPVTPTVPVVTPAGATPAPTRAATAPAIPQNAPSTAAAALADDEETAPESHAA